MKTVNPVILFLAAFLAVYFQVTFDLFRILLGAQINLLPALIVYASLTYGIVFVGFYALFCGLIYDSLSANPLGISVLPLFAAAIGIFGFRTLLLRERTYAQFVLGTSASGIVPILTLLSLVTVNQQPLFGLGTIWQLLVMTLIGGLMTPLIFRVLDRVGRIFNYAPLPETTFRGDREIKRGRT